MAAVGLATTLLLFFDRELAAQSTALARALAIQAGLTVVLCLIGAVVYRRRIAPQLFALEQELRQHRLDRERFEQRTAALRSSNTQLEQEIGERLRVEEQLKLADLVYRTSHDGVFVTDASGTILSVNPAFTTITGFECAEALGQNPRILKSHHQDPAFYETMWAELLEHGRFEGELWNRRKNGEAYLQRSTITVFRDEDGNPLNFVAVFADITDLHDKEAQIHHQYYHDALTDLPNRVLFQDRVKQALRRRTRTGDPVSLLLLDLDRFKLINETLGHEIGDGLLQAVAARLKPLLHQDDTISRLGGDEFVILLSGSRGLGEVEMAAQRILTAFARPFEVGGHQLSVTTSIGIAVAPNDGDSVGNLLKNSEAAMYRAKEAGRNGFQFYTADMNAKALDRLRLEVALRGAVERAEFEVFYQPRVHLRDRHVIGMEALVRWRHPEQGLLAPANYIPLAEETGLIIEIGRWVLAEACRQTRGWRDAGHDLCVSVNLSARQFATDVVGTVDTILRETGLPADRLELELTETVVMQDAAQTVAKLNALKARGVSLAVDDFGTGYSSLTYLKRFPIDVLKIDRSFVGDIPNDSDDVAIAETIIALGQSLGLEVVAEGIESAEQAEFMEWRGCDAGQGFYFSKPLPAQAFDRYLTEQQVLLAQAVRS